MATPLPPCPLRVLVIGAGWYGCHIAAEIKRSSPTVEVCLFERNNEIFSGISGQFGIRLHAGPHYPRSSATRALCQEGFLEFLTHYPELVNAHAYSHYGLGIGDIDGHPSKVSKEKFVRVCQEFGYKNEVSKTKWDYRSVEFVADIDEPSLVVGEPLRRFFVDHLQKCGVEIYCNYDVSSVTRDSAAGTSVVRVKDQSSTYIFHHVVNATSYKSVLPRQVPGAQRPMNAEVVYQACIVLTYDCTLTPLPSQPFSFIVMDGWYPCIMPYDDAHDENNNTGTSKYIFIHGKLTILGSFKSPEEAGALLGNLSDEFVGSKIRGDCEQDMARFWPRFGNTFRYTGWKGTVQAKLRTETEFRSALTFRSDDDGTIYVFPGKINNIFEIGREVCSLLGIRDARIVQDGRFSHVGNGIFGKSIQELKLNPDGHLQNTCDLQTYQELSAVNSTANCWEKS